MEKILTVSGLRVAFDDAVALDHIDLELEKGDSLAIIGPNGAGKSIFIKAIMNMVPHQGSIVWAPGTRIGYVPQKIDADRHLPITFNNLLESKAAVMHLKKGDIAEIVETVGLDARIMETPVGHLSGGQFQRGLIGFALLGKPNVLIFDEPTASIDKTGEEQIYEIVHRLQSRLGITTIVVSHDLSFVYRYATKVLCLNQTGTCYGKPEETLTPDILKKLYGSSSTFYAHNHPSNDAHAH